MTLAGQLTVPRSDAKKLPQVPLARRAPLAFAAALALSACGSGESVSLVVRDSAGITTGDHVLAGPYGTTILAELGADVIKVESSKGGMDPFRFFGTGEDPNLSPRFLDKHNANRMVAAAGDIAASRRVTQHDSTRCYR